MTTGKELKKDQTIGMSARGHLTILALVAGVVAMVFAVGYYKAPRLGLDLQGGLEIILKAQPDDPSEKLSPEDLQKSVEIIRDRVDRLGVSEPEIRVQGTDQIAVALPGVKDPEAAANVIGSTAQLKFYNYQESLVNNKFYRNPYQALSRVKGKFQKDLAAKKPIKTWYLFDSKQEVIAGPLPTRKQLFEEFDGKRPTKSQVFGVPSGEKLLHGQPDRLPGASSPDGAGRFDREKGVYFFIKEPTGDDLKNQLTGGEIDQATGETRNGGWVTTMTFSKRGGQLFGSITRDIAQEGALDQFDHHFAIVLDDEVKSVPTIDYKQYPDGIQGRNAEISGLENQEEARNLALVLNTGALPVKFVTQSKTQVSATLGKQSLRQGLLAGAAGLAIVMIYLVVFYRVLGLIADIALIIYAFIFYGLIVGIPIVMSLPGIAGMILTIGVAADANIIIFERVREEYKSGKNVRASIQAGYTKGLKTIVDANVITLITAVALFVIAVGTVRGFALLLLVGVILSMFTAVAVTFAFLGLLSKFTFFQHPFVIGGNRKPLRFHIPWMKYKMAMFAWIALIMVASLLFIGVKKLNLGIDFKSGTKIVATFQGSVSENQVRDQLSAVDGEYGKAVIQRVTDATLTEKEQKETSSYSIQLEKLKGQNGSDEVEIRRAFEDKLQLQQTKDEDGKFAPNISVTTIGASFGNAIAQAAIAAIILSMILVVAYVWGRFEWKFAVAVIAALTHDMIIAVGLYAFTGREFTSATVAALLTILGYSMYDTVIVFDRIRENVRVMRKSPMHRIVDRSLNEVLWRSINTSIVTLLPVVTIFLYGGETLKDFAWALMIGIFAGAYSSLIVASPILLVLKEREVVWKRRKSSVATGGADVVDGEASSAAVGMPSSTRSEWSSGVSAASTQAPARTEKVSNGASYAGGSSDASEADSSINVQRSSRDKRPRSKRKKK